MKKFIALIGIFAISYTGFANKIDSLFNLLQNSQEDTNRIDLLDKISAYYILKSSDSALIYAQKTIDLSQKLDFPFGIVRGNNQFGNYYDNTGEYDQAMAYYNKALAKANELNSTKGLAIVYNNIGNVYIHQTKLDSAMSMYFLALKAEEEINNLHGISEAYNNIGVVYYYQKNYDKCTEFLEKASKIQEEIGDVGMIKKTLLNISAIYLYQKQYRKALKTYFRALELSKSIGDSYDESMSLTNISTTYIHLKKMDSAKVYFDLAEKTKLKIKDQKGIVNLYYNFGEGLRNDGDLNQAKKYFNQALRLSYQINGSRYERMELYKSLSESYLQEKEYITANDYLKKYILLKDSIHSEEQTKIIAETEEKFETAKKDKELAESKERESASQLEAEQSKTQLLIGGILAGILVFGLILAFVLFRSKQKSITNHLIIEEKEKGLNAVIHTQEEERRRIAKELHDGVAQQLAGVKLRFQHLQTSISIDESEKENYSKSLELLEQTNQDIRSISHQMMPVALKESGLITAMEELLKNTFHFSDITYQYQLMGVKKEDRFADQVEITIYRIAQELINNILKHSKAQTVNVQLRKTKAFLILHIEDDGVGFDAKTKSKGIGLHNIISRAENVKGSINYESIEQGTSVNLRIPLTK